MSVAGVLELLENQVDRDVLVLDDELAAIPGWASLLALLGPSPLSIRDVVIDLRTGTMQGTCRVLGLPETQLSWTFGDDADGVGVSVEARIDPAISLDILGTATFGLTGATITVHLPGGSRSATGALRTTLRAGPLVLPVVIDLPAPVSGWAIRGDFDAFELPDLGLLAGLVADLNLANSLPADLGSVADSLTLSDFDLRWNGEAGTIASILLTVGIPGDWSVIPGHIDIRDAALSVASEDGADTSVQVSGAAPVGDALIPMSVARTHDNGWSFDLSSDRALLPNPATLLALLGDSVSLPLPDGMGTTGGFGLTQFQLVFDAADRSVRWVGAVLDVSDPWRPGFADFISVDSASISIATDKGTGVAAELTGDIAIGGASLRLTGVKRAGEPEWGLLEASLEQASLPLSGLTAQFMGGVPVPDLTIARLDVQLEPATENAQIIASLDGPWVIPLGLAELSVDDLTVELRRADPTGGGRVAGMLRGEASIPGASFRVDYDLEGELRIGTTIPKLRLSEILRPVGLPPPSLLADIELADIELEVTTDGEFRIAADSGDPWEIPIAGAGLRVESLAVSVARGAPADGTPPDVDCDITVTVAGLAIADELTLERFSLSFSARSGGAWSANGAIAASLMGLGLSLSASYTEHESSSVLGLESTLASKRDLVSLGSVGSLDLDGFSLQLETDHAAAGPPQRRWVVGAQGGAHLALAGISYDSDGRFEFLSENGATRLAFLPEVARIELPLNPFEDDSPPTITLNFTELMASRTDRAGWTVSAAVDVAFGGLPRALQDYLADLQPIRTTMEATTSAVTLTADPIVNPPVVEIPSISVGDEEFSLGAATIFARHLSISVGSQVDLSAELHVGLPAELNYIFGANDDGTPQLDVFRPYDPARPDQDLFKVELTVGTGGLAFRTLSSPFSFLDVVDGVASWDGNFGSLGFALPTFEFDPSRQTFEVDVALDVSELAIPLTPLTAALEAFQLEEIAEVLPRSLPFEPIDLMDDAGQLRVPELVGFLRNLGFDVPAELEDTLSSLAEPVNRLPAGLKHYLRVAWPSSFRLQISTTATGSVKFDFKVGEDSEPLRFLVPVLAPPPRLIGIELYGVSLGAIFGGALLVGGLDVRIDQFDLATIIGSLALPEEGLSILPASAAGLQKRIVVDNMVTIIIYQAGVPIPLPLFYDELGVEYWGLEGLQFGGHVSFGMPQFNIVELVRQIGVFKEFFTDPAHFLDMADTPEDMDLKPGTGPNYLTLPNYLGGGVLGDRDAVLELSAYQLAAKLLNMMKEALQSATALTVNDLIQLVPLDARVKSGTMSVAGISAGGAYAITTPREFVEHAYERLPLTGVTAEEAVGILPAPAAAARSETGICLFFGGGFSVGEAVTFEAVYALAATDSRFGTGFGIHGSLAGGAVDIALRGAFAVDPSARMPVDLEGHGHLTVLGRPVVAGDVSLGEQGFHLRGLVDLFPDGPVSLLLQLEGDLAEDECRFAGVADLSIGDGFTLAGGSFSLDTTQFVVSGTWLNQTATFSIEQFERDGVPGARFSAGLSPITIGSVFALNGDGPDGGPYAALEVLGDATFDLELSGAVDLLGVRGGTTVRLDDGVYQFAVAGRLLDVFAADLAVSAGSLADGVGFQVSANFQTDSVDDIATQALELLTGVASTAASELDDARRGVDGARRQLDDAITQAQAQVDSAQAVVQRLQSQINGVNRKIASLSSTKVKAAKNALTIAGLVKDRAALGAKKTAANMTLAAAKAVLGFAQTGTDVGGAVLTGALQGILQAAETARDRLNAAERNLRQLEARLGVAAQLANFAGTPLEIISIGFTAGVERVRGATVALEMQLSFLGEPTPAQGAYVLSCQLTSPAAVAEALVDSLLDR